MVKQAELARQWGISRVMVFKLVKKGCPLTSLKAANAWKAANPPKRAATNRKVPVAEVKAIAKAVKVTAKLSRINPRAAEKSRKATTKPVGRSKAPPVEEKLPAVPVLTKSGDSLLDALNGAIMASDYALEKFMDAAANHPVNAGARLSEYTRALATRFTAEESYRKEMQIRKILIDKGVAFQTSRQAIEAVLRRLKRMPIELGPQCNPQEPLLATKIMQRAVEEIIATGSKEIHAIRAARES